MSLFQNYRLFFGLYSKNIATFWDLEDWRDWIPVSPFIINLNCHIKIAAI